MLYPVNATTQSAKEILPKLVCRLKAEKHVFGKQKKEKQQHHMNHEILKKNPKPKPKHHQTVFITTQKWNKARH